MVAEVWGGFLTPLIRVIRMSLGRYPSSYYILCATAFLMMLSISMINPILSIYAKSIGATGVWIGYAVSGYWITRVLLEIPSGYISSKYGYYRPMLAAMVITLVGNVLLVFIKTPVQLVLVRAMKGIGGPLFFAIAMTFMMNLFDAEGRGTAMGVFQGIEFIGTIIGSGISGYTIDVLGFKGGFVVAVGLSALALVLLVVPKGLRMAAVAEGTRQPLKVGEIFEALTNRNVMIMALATLAEFIMSTGLIMTVVPLHAQESLGFSLTKIGFIMGARSIGFVIAMFTMGSISDRIGRKPVLLFGLVGRAIMTVIMSFMVSFYAIAGIICVIGFTSGAIWIIGPVLSSESVRPELRGAAIGAYRTFFDLGSLVGPILMTMVMDGYGVTACFYLASALLLLNLPTTMMIRRTSIPEAGSGEVLH